MASLADLVLPVRCVACRAVGELVCERCRGDFHVLSPPLCGRCGSQTAWPVDRCVECSGRLLSFRSARGAVAYEGAARRVVAGWKERGLRRLAEAAAELVAGVVPCPSAAVVSFVPGDADRTLWRGQNTAEALAVCLGGRWGLPVEPLLARTGPARRQRGLDRRLRRANARGRFRARTDAPSTVVLVDDVYTTGATASAAATELRRAGARAVDVVTFARAIRR